MKVLKVDRIASKDALTEAEAAAVRFDGRNAYHRYRLACGHTRIVATSPTSRDYGRTFKSCKCKVCGR